jgi:hypothetical protein
MIGGCVFDVCYTVVPFSQGLSFSQGYSNQRPLLFKRSLQPKASPFHKVTPTKGLSFSQCHSNQRPLLFTRPPLLLLLQILYVTFMIEKTFFYIIFEIVHTFCTAQSKLIIQKCIKVPYKYV